MNKAPGVRQGNLLHPLDFMRWHGAVLTADIQVMY
jgi:hypothetical protein